MSEQNSPPARAPAALCLALLLSMALTGLSHGATPESESTRTDTFASPPPNWHSLVLRDTGVIGSVTTRIDLRVPTETELRSALFAGQEVRSPRLVAPPVQELEVTSRVSVLLGTGIESRSRLWFNADGGLPLQLVRTSLGKNPSRKRYRFGSHQVDRLRTKPDNPTEAEQAPEHWSQSSESRYPLPDTDGVCAKLLESSQLLYLLSSPTHAVSVKPEVLCVFDRKRVYRVAVQMLEREAVAVDYLQVVAGREKRVTQTPEALHVVVTSKPLEASEADKEAFSFLGLQGEIHLLLSDPERIPLRIRGQVPGYGMIELELEELTR
jgi:hypothetical protein